MWDRGLRFAGACVLLALPAHSLPAQVIAVGTAVGQRGAQGLLLPVALDALGTHVRSVQFTLRFDGSSAPPAGLRPDCMVNPDLGATASRFRFTSTGCNGTPCTQIRGFIRLRNRDTEIADGAMLFTCRVGIAAAAAVGNYPVTIVHVKARDINGKRQFGALGFEGNVSVLASETLEPAAQPTIALPLAPP